MIPLIRPIDQVQLSRGGRIMNTQTVEDTGIVWNFFLHELVLCLYDILGTKVGPLGIKQMFCFKQQQQQWG